MVPKSAMRPINNNKNKPNSKKNWQPCQTHTSFGFDM